MTNGLVGPGGEPLGPEAPPVEEVREVAIPPKENAELRAAQEEKKEIDMAMSHVGRVIIMNLAAAFEILHKQGENEERRIKAQERAVKATGVHADSVRGYKLDRGMVIIAKKKTN